MSDFIAYSGWGFGVLAVAINLYQWYAQSISKNVVDVHDQQLLALKTSLAQLLAQLNETGRRRTIIKGKVALEWVGTVGHKVRMIEHQVNIMLGLVFLPTKPRGWFKRFWGKLFPLAVRDEIDRELWQRQAARIRLALEQPSLADEKKSESA